DWSSDVCSSDLAVAARPGGSAGRHPRRLPDRQRLASSRPAGRADPTSVLPPDRWREPALEDAPLSPEEHPMSTIDIADRTEVLIARHQEALSAGTHPADLDLLASAVAGNACEVPAMEWLSRRVGERASIMRGRAARPGTGTRPPGASAPRTIGSVGPGEECAAGGARSRLKDVTAPPSGLSHPVLALPGRRPTLVLGDP